MFLIGCGFWNGDSKCHVVVSKAVATANNNILEVSALNMKLTKAGVLLGIFFSRESMKTPSTVDKSADYRFPRLNFPSSG